MNSEWPLSGDDIYHRESPESPSHFPAMRHITLWSTPQSFELLSNITSLDIDRATFHTWGTWRSVLMKAPHLEHLKVSNQESLSDSYITTLGPPTLTMPRLRTVNLGLPNHNSFILRWLQDVDSSSVRTFSLFIEISVHGDKREAGEKISSFLCNYVSLLFDIVGHI